MKAEWIEHRRGVDGELLGWIAPSGDEFVAIDLLGRPRTGAVDWLSAEEELSSIGIGYLADRYELRLAGNERLIVRITEVNAEHVTLRTDDSEPTVLERSHYTLPLPAPENLRTLAEG